ncbi:ABC transporter permease [Microbacterium sp. SORGH_AS_0888]|uniref:ABC transporter permease n=1 Tax=Microbacterium sp. SORGH_AS_0888 TaxID=3041791 RepID=UPI0027821D97|nr:ABC transporter permease [Microbacterium sp. SORGH_AS_0888]MDQ1130436.1 peptide/nickel transport system permease protein [Microbacterium sp. SORGH_AS_0888]
MSALDIADGPAVRARRMRRLPSAGTVVVVAGLLLVLVLCVVGDSLSPWPATKVIAAPYLPPDAQHLFGTDSAGMDVFARTVAGLRIDVAIGVATAVVSTVLGLLIGLCGGLVERSRSRMLRFVGQVIFRALDLLQALPAIIIGLVLVAFFGISPVTLIAAMVVALTPNQARLVRAEVLRVSGEVYIENARVSGESVLSTAFRYVLPNSAWPALENSTLVFASTVALVAGLGFLGVGLAPPTPEWGAMISTEVSGVLTGYWWPVLFPAVAMMLTTVLVVALNRRLVRVSSP